MTHALQCSVTGNLCSRGNEFVLPTAVAPALSKVLGYGSYLIMFTKSVREIMTNSNAVISVFVESIVLYYF